MVRRKNLWKNHFWGRFLHTGPLGTPYPRIPAWRWPKFRQIRTSELSCHKQIAAAKLFVNTRNCVLPAVSAGTTTFGKVWTRKNTCSTEVTEFTRKPGESCGSVAAQMHTTHKTWNLCQSGLETCVLLWVTKLRPGQLTLSSRQLFVFDNAL